MASRPSAGRDTPAPAVAIVGRPNVGKSTLFNRLVGRRAALIHDRPGVTRDRKEAEAELLGLSFRLIDTAGLDDAGEDAIESRMVEQTMRAVASADLILFLIDARAGVTALDRHFADRVRRSGVPVVLIANKCEGRSGTEGLYEAFALGMGEPVAISAEHGEGMGDLYQALADRFEPKDGEREGGTPDGIDEGSGDAGAEEVDAPARAMSLAIVGRPNAGKSTLFNRLLEDERVITGPEPGLTRDAIAIDWSWRDHPIRLIDTAGLRRRARVDDAVEKLSVNDTRHAIQYADIVLLIVDAQSIQDFGGGLERQDLTIARQVEEEGRGLVIVANKWDLIEDPQKTRRAITESLDRSLSQLRGVPVVCISALRGTGLERLMEEVLRIEAVWNSRISTGRLNNWLARMQEEHQAPLVGGRRIKIRYVTQVKARPPTFALFANKPEDLPDSYVRYLTNGLRRDFGFDGVPLRLHLRKGRNPYAK